MSESENYNRVARVDPLVAKDKTPEQHAEAFKAAVVEAEKVNPGRRKTLIYILGWGVTLAGPDDGRGPAIRMISDGMTAPELVTAVGAILTKGAEGRIFNRDHLRLIARHAADLASRTGGLR